MRVLITGATGFVGRALTLRLRRDGHEVVAWVRSLPRARTLLGQEAELVPAEGGQTALVAALETCQAAINLAGAPLFGRRWDAAQRAAIVRSRVDTTALLVAALGACRRRPEVLVSASAVGCYGSRGAAVLDEAAPFGDDFLADVCRQWEAAARPAEALGVRLVLPRIGIVLGHEGGVLGQLLPLFQAGVGGPLGSGTQMMPWIHLHDLVDVFVAALGDRHLAGPLNACAPEPVSNAAFTEALAAALGVRAPVWVPAWALRLRLGRAAQVALASQRAVPARLTDHGFAFRFASLGPALAHLLPPAAVHIGALGADDPAPLQPEAAYLRARRPRYLLRARTQLMRPQAQVFDFFCRAENLGLMTPSHMALTIEGTPPATMAAGLTIDYTLRVGPLPLRWRTEIMHWAPPSAFVDAQLRGPYRCWWHEHHVRPGPTPDSAEMEDRVFYALPLGPLGPLAHALNVRQQLQRIFWYRTSAIALRFGT